MKKSFIVILILCFCLVLFITFMLNKRISTLQDNYDQLQDNYASLQSDYDYLSYRFKEHMTAVTPITVDEVETYQHNLDTLNAFYGVPSERPAAIASRCFSLQREGSMSSARIKNIIKHDIPSRNYYCIEIITEDDEHYSFHFEYNSANIYAIFKGENDETLLYGEVM